MDIPAPAPGTQTVQLTVRIPSILIGALASIEIAVAPKHACKIVELQHAPGFMIEEIKTVKSTYRSASEIVGVRAEKDAPIQFKVANLQNETKEFSGVLFVEDDEPAYEGHAIPNIPGLPETHNTGSPQGQGSGPVSRVEPGSPMSAIGGGGYAIAETAKVQIVGQMPMTQNSSALSAPPGSVAREGEAGGEGDPSYDEYLRWKSQSQQVPRAQVPQNQTQASQVTRPGEVGILLSAERASKVSFAMRGGVVMPQELPAIISPIEAALLQPEHGGVPVYAGANERLIILTRMQALRTISILQNQDSKDLHIITKKFAGEQP